MKFQECKSDIAVLGFFLGRIRVAKLDPKRLSMVKRDVLSLVRYKWPVLISKYEKERQAHAQKRAELVGKSLRGIKEVFEVLSLRVLENNLIVDHLVKRSICIIECMFNCKITGSKIGTVTGVCYKCGAPIADHRVYVMPSYELGLYQEVCYLCNRILELGYQELVEEFVEIRDVTVSDFDTFLACRCFHCGYLYNRESASKNVDGTPVLFSALREDWVCPGCGLCDFWPVETVLPLKERQIVRFTFAQSILDLKGFYNTSFKSIPTWSHWFSLCEIDNDTGLTDAFLGYDDRTSIEKSCQLLEQHSTRGEINAVLEGRQGNDALELYQRDSQPLESFYYFKSGRKIPGPYQQQRMVTIFSYGKEVLIASLECLVGDLAASLGQDPQLSCLVVPQVIKHVVLGDRYSLEKLYLQVLWSPGVAAYFLRATFQEPRSTTKPGKERTQRHQKVRDFLDLSGTERLKDAGEALRQSGIKGIEYKFCVLDQRRHGITRNEAPPISRLGADLYKFYEFFLNTEYVWGEPQDE